MAAQLPLLGRKPGNFARPPDQKLSLYLRDIRCRVEAVSASIICKIWPAEVPALDVSSRRIARFAPSSAA